MKVLKIVNINATTNVVLSEGTYNSRDFIDIRIFRGMSPEVMTPKKNGLRIEKLFLEELIRDWIIDKIDVKLDTQSNEVLLDLHL